MSLIVAALGGNAIIRPGQKGTIKEQFDNTFESMGHIASLVRAGHRVVLTHGNGPQVGFIMIQAPATATSAFAFLRNSNHFRLISPPPLVGKRKLTKRLSVIIDANIRNEG